MFKKHQNIKTVLGLRLPAWQLRLVDLTLEVSRQVRDCHKPALSVFKEIFDKIFPNVDLD